MAPLKKMYVALFKFCFDCDIWLAVVPAMLHITVNGIILFTSMYVLSTGQVTTFERCYLMLSYGITMEK